MSVYGLFARILDRVKLRETPERLRWKWRYFHWRLAGRGPYSDQYVQQISAGIAAGKRHGTLSKALSDPDLALRTARFVAETAEELGIEPGDTCIEYGCGALRVGEQLMKMVQPGHYIGLDVTDRFWKNGIERLGPEFIGRHQPVLELIDENIGRWAEVDAGLVVCIAVIIHVPPPELDDFIAKLGSVMSGRTLLLIDTRFSARTRQVHYRTWEHSRLRAERLFAKHGLQVVSAGIRRPGLPEDLWVLKRSDGHPRAARPRP